MSGQLDIFAPPPAPKPDPAKANPWGLRYYQRDILDNVARCHQDARSTLVVSATGTGKTVCFAALAGNHPGRVLILVHRRELVDQAASTLERMLGERIGIERAEQWAWKERIVVGSVQTVCKPDRLAKMVQMGFTLLIPDEAHHFAAPSFRRVLAAFPDAKVAGFTATPDRGDERALGLEFETVAYTYGIEQAIPDGYLVPIEGRKVSVNEIDLADVGTVAGDLHAGDLDTVMMRAAEGVAAATLREFPTQKGIVFMPGKQSALYTHSRLNALKPGCSAVLVDDGAMLGDEEVGRDAVMRAVRGGTIQWLTACLIPTEGFDWLEAQVMIGARPTKSRSLYAQMVGRITRPLRGVVDNPTIPDTPEGASARRAAIAASSKPFAIIADFVGNAGKHDLASVEDVLGGNYDEDVVAEAKKLAKEEGGGDPSSLLQRAEAAIAAMKARRTMAAVAKRQQGKVSYDVTAYDPFAMCGIRGDLTKERAEQKRYDGRLATEPQLKFLADLGFDLEKLGPSVPFSVASKLITAAKQRRTEGLATQWQLNRLAPYGVGPEATLKNAGRAVEYCTSLGWGRRAAIDPATVLRLARGE